MVPAGYRGSALHLGSQALAAEPVVQGPSAVQPSQLPLSSQRAMVTGLRRWGHVLPAQSRITASLSWGQSRVLEPRPALAVLFRVGLLLPWLVWPSPCKGFGSWQVIYTPSVTSMSNVSSPFLSLFHYPFLSSAGIVQIILALTAKPH